MHPTRGTVGATSPTISDDAESVAVRLCDRVYSSRKIAVRLERDVAFRVLLGNGEVPQHRTICEFRRRHLADFQEAFVSVVQMAREAGLVKLGKVAIDGTKVRGRCQQASFDVVRSDGGGGASAEGRSRAFDGGSEARDQAEDEEHGVEVRGMSCRRRLRCREDRLATIQQAKQRLAAEQALKDQQAGRVPDPDRDLEDGEPGERDECVPADRVQSNFTPTPRARS